MDDPATGRRRIVTHQRPHLDEVVCIWLLKTFDPAYAEYSVEFIPYFGTVPTGQNIISIGIGGGPYDEHQMKGRASSATQLVFDDLVSRQLVPAKGYELPALKWLIEYSDQVDQAQIEFKDEKAWPFSLPSLIRSHIQRTKDDQDTIRFGLEIVDDVMDELNSKAKFGKDWAERVEFACPWGKGVAVLTDYGSTDTYAYSHGYALRIQQHRTNSVVSLKGDPELPVDLSSAYAQAIKVEPNTWFLHQSKRMMIANGNASVGKVPTKFSLTQLIDLVKT